ncbi:hypothetical protein DICPUDRAFT_99654 [Dictyostelium purpureum]|uniref:Coronin n=1 Tax=Dictyostelium purpureum TaxID=5786 RepID=F1A1A0_DICPU|nr:uncharacterized protein DICPUDRAFT_99654 [Dictyostelium purpureum]EGC30031.1 hypothetical protein DICPUDRAFT_99654 [Dictyostelium purpureum]|eukprot:XP_003293442.1 hypothetical protein DICPUDRAFT_99654 [Dictyostelium purpureum]
MFKLNVSKYRHTNGKVDKRELWYPDVNTSGSSAATTFIKANSKWIGLNWQSNTGTVGIIPLKSYGKRKGETFLVHAHSSTLTDFEFNPFNEHQLVTASDDSTIKVWNIREAMQSGVNTLSSPAVTCSGHSKSVDAIAFNPSAENILASVSQDKTLKIWDLSSGEEKFSYSFDNALLSISWNYDGSLIFATGKDLKNRVIDPRTGESVQVGDGHQGVKPSRCVWLGNSPFIATVGFSKMRERQVSLWNSSDLSKAIKTITLDSSTGIINPIYDQDAQLLFISGSGDSTVRVFDLNTQFTKEPAFTEIQNVPTDTPAKGICAIPKRALDVMEVEIDRLLKATPNNIVPITFSMARKSKSQFADDLFPNTISTKPSLSSNEWLSGENKEPILMSLNPIDNPVQDFDDLSVSSPSSEPEKKMTFFVDDNNSDNNNNNNESSASENLQEEQEEKSSPNTSSPASPVYSSSSLQNENINRTGYVPKVVRSSKYRHVVGTTAQKNQFYTNLKVNGSTSNTCIAVNREYVAVPYQGIGGPLAVIPLASKGRQITVPCIEIGSQLCDFDLSQFNSSIVATGSEDSHVKIFKVPEGGLPKNGKNYTTVEADLIGHNRKVVSVNFHPTAEEVLISTGGDMVVKIWDLNSAQEKLSFDGHTDMITSVDVNYTGDLFLTSCKDKKMRIFDPRTNTLVSETITHNGVKGAKSVWLGQTGNIFSVGFNKSSEREYQLWDSRNLSSHLVEKKIDQLSGVITPFYDEDSGVVYLAGKGDGSIRMFEINNEDPYVHYLTEYNSGSPQIGVAKVSQKTLMDVKKCEISRFYKVTADTIEPISMTVPRNRTEFFQDDIYPDTRSGNPSMTSEEWFNGETRQCEMVSLQPQGMVALSNAPPPPKKEEKIIAPQIVDQTPSKDQFTNSLLSRVSTQNAYSNWEQIQKLKDSVSSGITFEDPVSDSEWD